MGRVRVWGASVGWQWQAEAGSESVGHRLPAVAWLSFTQLRLGLAAPFVTTITQATQSSILEAQKYDGVGGVREADRERLEWRATWGLAGCFRLNWTAVGREG